ncbi:UNVERIFIED_CONTAM: hypothetical protein BEN50_21595 [Euhalothece sp. KZN 001]
MNNYYLTCDLKLPFSQWTFECKESIKSFNCNIDYLDEESDQKCWVFQNRIDYLKAKVVTTLRELEFELEHEHRKNKIDYLRNEIVLISEAVCYVEGCHPENFAANS